MVSDLLFVETESCIHNFNCKDVFMLPEQTMTMQNSDFHSENTFFTVLFTKGIRMADATDCHGNWIFSGPDGIKPFARYKLRDTSYIGHTTFSRERTSDVRHMWRAPWWSANFPAKSGRVGAIGWNTWSFNDWRLLKSGNQVRSGPAGPFRTAVAHRIVNEGVY